MSWTDERVNLLKKLWMDGLSASQIASELSGGVTRNAVIGKVHRLKLSARAKPANATPRPKAPRPQGMRPTASTPRSSGGGGASRMSDMASAAVSARTTHAAPMIGATALQIDTTPVLEVETTPRGQELFIPVAERISLLQLSEKTCKWPIGDPVSPEFHFCGRESEDSKPYCEFHARKAYHQIDRKRR